MSYVRLGFGSRGGVRQVTLRIGSLGMLVSGRLACGRIWQSWGGNVWQCELSSVRAVELRFVMVAYAM